jgi:SHS2 domain-containing protein
VAASHRFESHVSEVKVVVEAQAIESLFEQAALALAELLAEPEGDGPLGPWRPVRVEARDRASLLAQWLDELVFLSETEKVVYREVKVESVTATTLEARVRGAQPGAIRTAIKAATYHDLSVERRGDGWIATVVLDA